MTAGGVEQVWRTCAPEVLATLIRRHGDFGAAEDAVQEALLAAGQQWPRDGLPDNPAAWLTAVARRRLVDHWRSERARSAREQLVALDDWHPTPEAGERDDSLTLLFLCCHPALTRPPPYDLSEMRCRWWPALSGAWLTRRRRARALSGYVWT